MSGFIGMQQLWSLSLTHLCRVTPVLVKPSQVIVVTFLNNPLKAPVFCVAFEPFCTTLFSFRQLSINVLGYSALQPARLFSDDLPWLAPLVDEVSDCIL